MRCTDIPLVCTKSSFENHVHNRYALLHFVSIKSCWNKVVVFWYFSLLSLFLESCGIVCVLQAAPDAVFSTAVTSLKPEDAFDPNRVKCVVDNRGYAIYFSRGLIPFNKWVYGFCMTGIFSLPSLFSCWSCLVIFL